MSDPTQLQNELEELKRTDQIVEWSCTLGYGDAEYTVDFNKNASLDLKFFAKRLGDKFGASNFTKHRNGSTVSVKFVVGL